MLRLRISRGLADLRHRFRRGMGRVLGGLFGPRRLAGPLDLTGVRTILVCRINGRMGNTLFLTPLIRHLHQETAAWVDDYQRKTVGV